MPCVFMKVIGFNTCRRFAIPCGIANCVAFLYEIPSTLPSIMHPFASKYALFFAR